MSALANPKALRSYQVSLGRTGNKFQSISEKKTISNVACEKMKLQFVASSWVQDLIGRPDSEVEILEGLVEPCA